MELQRKRLQLVIAVIAIVLIIVVPSMYYFYISNNKPPVITSSNDSASHTLMFSFQYNNFSQDSASFKNYGANSTMRENGIPYVTLRSTMNGNVWAFGNHPNAFMDYLVLNVSGKISHGLRASGMTISVEPLSGSQSPFTAYIGESLTQVDYMSVYKKPVNVTSFAGSQNLNLKFLNNTLSQRDHVFNYSLTDTISTVAGFDTNLQYNTTYGLSITTTLLGLPKPVSTTLYIFFINMQNP